MAPSDTNLEDRLGRLEALEDLRGLKNLYAQICDTGYNGGALAELFTEDGTWESNTFPLVRGRSEIKRFMDRFGSGVFPWAVHYMSNPRIEVSGDLQSARGRWELLQLATKAAESGSFEPIIAMGSYDDEFIKIDGTWRFAKVSVHFHHVGNISKGWAAENSPKIAALTVEK
ncbi:nuclear transport factor 2 family protein [Arthrobacter sp. NPDC080073]|uniref:nuclear transport factor 2 family protein n=1 Tax=Arthrobacter sp. NPDC080073 TaxID=3155919 RepID=UPI0034403933